MPQSKSVASGVVDLLKLGEEMDAKTRAQCKQRIEDLRFDLRLFVMARCAKRRLLDALRRAG